MIKAFTTLELLKAHTPCEDGLETLTNYLGEDYADDKPINLLTILTSNGVHHCLWAFRAATKDLSKEARLIAADCAESVLYIYQNKYPGDARPKNAIRAARDFANGLIDRDAAATRAAYAAGAANAAARAYSAYAAARAYAANAAARASAARAAGAAGAAYSAYAAARAAARVSAAHAADAANAAASAAAAAAANGAAYAAAREKEREKQKEIIKKYLSE